MLRRGEKYFKYLEDKHIPESLDGISLGMDATGIGGAFSWIPDVIKMGVYSAPNFFLNPNTSTTTELGLDILSMTPFLGSPLQGTRLANKLSKTAHRSRPIEKLLNNPKVVNGINKSLRLGKNVDKASDANSVLDKSSIYKKTLHPILNYMMLPPDYVKPIYNDPFISKQSTIQYYNPYLD